MPATLLTPANIRYIKKHRLTVSGADMARRFHVRKSVVNQFMRKNGLAVSAKRQKMFRAESLRRTIKTSATAAQDQIIKNNYLIVPEKRLAKMIGRSDTFVRTRLRQLGLKIPKKIIEQRKIDSRIKPGQTPPNKGKKQSDYMTKEQIKKTVGTRFKKGHLPKNTKSDGVISIRHNHQERGGPPYKWIRISKANWKMLHVHNWEKEHGPAPEGMIIVFKNGDTMNCETSNLEIITLAENMKRNTIHNLPPELKETIHNIRKLNNKIKKHEKQINRSE